MNEAITKAIGVLRAFGDDAPIRDRKDFAGGAITALTALQQEPAREEAEALVKRLRNPPFGTETSERNLMHDAAAFIARHHWREIMTDYTSLATVTMSFTKAEIAEACEAETTPAPLDKWEKLADDLYNDRQTVTPDNAFEAFQILNTRAVDLRKAIPELITMVRERDLTIDELDFLRHEGGPDSVAALEARATAAEARVGELEAALKEARNAGYRSDLVKMETIDRVAAENRVTDAKAEIAELKSSVVAFCAPWAAQYSETFGLPKDHLHPTHYDILEKCGARMVDFTRADLGRQE